MQHEAAAHLEANGQRTASGQLMDMSGSHRPAQSLLSGTYGTGYTEEAQERNLSNREQLAEAERQATMPTPQGSTQVTTESLQSAIPAHRA